MDPKNFSTAEFKMALTNTASKRYTKSRIQRFLCYLLFNIHKEQMKAVLSQKFILFEYWDTIKPDWTI